MSDKKELQKSEPKTRLTASEAFTQKVMAEFQGKVGGKLELPETQRNLIQGYFIGVDKAIKAAEENRLRNNKWKRDKEDLPVTWNNVNMTDLALDVMHYSKLGLDITQKNNINAIPFKNNRTNKYDIGFIPGYVGIQLTAYKYAREVPVSVTTELVYKNDTFRIIKKSAEIPYDRYIFEIDNPFDRGDIVGGFGYIEFKEPKKNRLVFMSMHDIEKRKPKYAAAEFWGGDKDKWEKGKKVGTEHIEGWYEEMCLKTLKRFVYGESNIERDPENIDVIFIGSVIFE
ncbi:MAG TPA: recombinase RecT, partial [Clostridia bacterium]|nr:recombinase RecT [Clostridia bacterium]